jgi:hypothetical protein
MEYQENTRRRVRGLDGTSFRFVRKGDELFVNGMAAHVQALAGSIVALVSIDQTVQVTLSILGKWSLTMCSQRNSWRA